MQVLARLVKWTATASAAAVLLAVAGFLLFVGATGPSRLPGGVKADGIVALTGGKARIGEAVKLLGAGRAKRMLITGVNPTTTSQQLSRLVPNGRNLFNCCIDLGRQAEDTTGNALETRKWVRLHNFKSIIVVTSSYHMPRTLVEFERAMPGVAFTPFAVASANLKMDAWWAYPGTLRLLFSEYVKYIRALSRFGVARFLGQSKPSDAPRTTATAG